MIIRRNSRHNSARLLGNLPDMTPAFPKGRQVARGPDRRGRGCSRENCGSGAGNGLAAERWWGCPGDRPTGRAT
jgi:hypothetical protein